MTPDPAAAPLASPAAPPGVKTGPVRTAAVLVVLLPVFVVGVASAAMALMKRSEAYALALARATAAPEVQAALGTPITPSFLVTGSTSTRGDRSTAEFETTLEGPKGRATLDVDGAQEGAHPWRFVVLDVSVEGGPTFDLRAPEER